MIDTHPNMKCFINRTKLEGICKIRLAAFIQLLEDFFQHLRCIINQRFSASPDLPIGYSYCIADALIDGQPIQHLKIQSSLKTDGNMKSVAVYPIRQRTRKELSIKEESVRSATVPRRKQVLLTSLASTQNRQNFNYKSLLYVINVHGLRKE